MQFILDNDIDYDFVWMDYCGGFSNYCRDIDALLTKTTHNMKLVATYSTYDPKKEDFTHYFVKVFNHIIKQTRNKYQTPIIFEDISGKYNKIMYQIGIELKPIENQIL